jgi:hypothetical protein
MKKTFGSKPEDRHESRFLIEEEEILSELADKKGTSLFLGKYTENVVLEIFDRNGFFKKVQKKGLWPLDYELDSSAFPPSQRLLVFYKAKSPENVIMDLKIKEGIFRFKNELVATVSNAKFSFLFLDWLTVQNPLHRFSRERPPLPGQTHPGLNLGRKTVDIFADLGKLNLNNGLMAYPAFFHIALVFFPRCRFINPDKTGEVLAIWKTFGKLGFSKLAWIVHLECLKKEDGTVYKWESEEMVYPMCRELKKYFHSRSYKRKAKEAMKKKAYKIDWEGFAQKFEAEMASLEGDSNPKPSS